MKSNWTTSVKLSFVYALLCRLFFEYSLPIYAMFHFSFWVAMVICMAFVIWQLPATLKLVGVAKQEEERKENLEPSVNISEGVDRFHNAKTDTGFYLVDPSLITLYQSRRQGERHQMHQILNDYDTKRRELRFAQKRYKAALKQIAEYKKFGALQLVSMT